MVHNPDLLVFYLGSFLEQKQALNAKIYTQAELQEIWNMVTKSPLGIDHSETKGFQVHSSLLKQPALAESILCELINIYQNSQTLMSDIIKHRNCPVLEVENMFNDGLKNENWTEILWTISSENLDLKQHLINKITDNGSLVERIKYYALNNFATNPISNIISICLQYSLNKKFVQDMFFYLQRNERLSLNNFSDVLLNRKTTSLKVLKHIWTQVKRLNSVQKSGLLTHPNVDNKLLIEMLKYFNLEFNRDVSLFNACLWILKNKTLSEENLLIIYLQSLNHLEMLDLVIKHPTFNKNWAWWTLSDPQYINMPPLNRELLKSTVK